MAIITRRMIPAMVVPSRREGLTAGRALDVITDVAGIEYRTCAAVAAAYAAGSRIEDEQVMFANRIARQMGVAL